MPSAKHTYRPMRARVVSQLFYNYMSTSHISSYHIFHRARVAQLVEHRGCHAGSREFDTGRTNTKGLKIIEEKVLPL